MHIEIVNRLRSTIDTWRSHHDEIDNAKMVIDRFLSFFESWQPHEIDIYMRTICKCIDTPHGLMNPLQYAAFINNDDVVRILIEHILPDARTLRWVIRHGTLETVKMLIDQGAHLRGDINAAFLEACICGHTNIVKVLMTHCPIDIHYNNEQPAKIACKFGYLNMFKLFVSNGVDLHFRQNLGFVGHETKQNLDFVRGQNPGFVRGQKISIFLDIAMQYNQLHIVEYIREVEFEEKMAALSCYHMIRNSHIGEVRVLSIIDEFLNTELFGAASSRKFYDQYLMKKRPKV